MDAKRQTQAELGVGYNTLGAFHEEGRKWRGQFIVSIKMCWRHSVDDRDTSVP